MMQSTKKVYSMPSLPSIMQCRVTRSEKRGNRQITIGGKPIDVKTREDWRKLGNSIRRKLNVDIDEEVTDSGGMRDYTYMQYRPNPNRRIR